MSKYPAVKRAVVKPACTDVAGVSQVQFDPAIYQNRPRLMVWCGAYLLGSVFTLFWFMALTRSFSDTRPVGLLERQELVLVMPSQPEASLPKPLEPKPRKLPRQPPQVVPTTNDSSPVPPPVVPDPPPISPREESASTVSLPAPDEPIKVEPLFRLTRLPDFGNATTLKYPVAEKNRGQEGKVIAEFVIDEQGRVRDIKILKSASVLFDQAVIDELGKISFTPSYIGERPVAARFRREFQFKLD